jgi:lysophospholipase L1-like esterase
VRWRSFVATGDSFTEGMSDPYPDGSYRGWADLVAARLAVEAGPDFGYANLAIRGRLFERVVSEQLPATLAMKPDLISFAAGGNDMLRRRIDTAALMARFDEVVGELRATGADVLLFRFADVLAHLPGQRLWAQRAAVLNAHVGRVAEKHGAIMIDLYGDDEFHNPVMWAEDRLHMSPAGHRRVAAHVLTALNVGVDEDWLIVPPRPAPTPWLAARSADLRWVQHHFTPWFKRRLTGRSSGDLITPKRPELAPIRDDEVRSR